MPPSSPAPEEAIRECPWCKSRDISAYETTLAPEWYLECESCFADGPLASTQAAAIAAWNRRAGGEREQQLEAALEFYRDVWTRNFPWIELLDDRGAKARAALAGQTEGERNG